MFRIGISRTIPFPGTSGEESKVLGEYARTFRARLQRGRIGTQWILESGAWLATHPNELKWWARIRREEGSLRVEAWTRVLPWSRPRAQRILAARADQLVDFIATHLRSGALSKFSEPAARRPFVPVGRGIEAGCVTVTTWAVQTGLALLLAMIPALVLGRVIVRGTIHDLSGRAKVVERAGEIPLPSRAELSQIDGTFRTLASAVLVGPFVFLSAFLYALVHLGGDLKEGVSRLSGWAWLFVVLWLGVGFWGAVTPVVGVLAALAIPSAAHLGISLVWSLRRERRREPGAVRGGGLLPAFLMMVLLLVVLVSLIPTPGSDAVEGLGRYRDRMLTFAPARWVAEMYYRTTRYAAESEVARFQDPDPGRSMLEGTVRTALVCSRSDSAVAAARALDLVVERVKREDVVSRAGEGRHDFYICESDEASVAALSKEGLQSRSVLLMRPGQRVPVGFRGIVWTPRKAVTQGAAQLRSHLTWLSENDFPTRGLNGLVGSGWLALYYAGPIFLLLLICGAVTFPIAFIYRTLSTGLAHGVVGLIFVASTGIVGWSLANQAESLKKIRTIRSTPANRSGALARLMSDASAEVRYEAAFQAWILLGGSNVRDPGLLDALLLGLRDGDVRVRMISAGSLGRFGDRRATSALLLALQDPDFFVRYRSAGALGDIGAVEAEQPLVDLMRRGTWYEGAYALMALRELVPGKY